MRVYYKLDEKYIGKQHCNNKGCFMLTKKLSQKVLKELFNKGNKFVLKDER